MELCSILNALGLTNQRFTGKLDLRFSLPIVGNACQIRLPESGRQILLSQIDVECSALKKCQACIISAAAYMACSQVLSCQTFCIGRSSRQVLRTYTNVDITHIRELGLVGPLLTSCSKFRPFLTVRTMSSCERLPQQSF